MKNFVIDSSAWLEYAGGSNLAKKFAPYIEPADPSSHYTPTVVLYEVYKRTKSQFGEESAMERLGEITSHTHVVNLNASLAIAAAEISIDEKLAFADSIVRATAKRFDARIVTSDAHFEKLDQVVYFRK